MTIAAARVVRLRKGMLVRSSLRQGPPKDFIGPAFGPAIANFARRKLKIGRVKAIQILNAQGEIWKTLDIGHAASAYSPDLRARKEIPGISGIPTRG